MTSTLGFPAGPVRMFQLWNIMPELELARARSWSAECQGACVPTFWRPLYVYAVYVLYVTIHKSLSLSLWPLWLPLCVYCNYLCLQNLYLHLFLALSRLSLSVSLSLSLSLSLSVFVSRCECSPCCGCGCVYVLCASLCRVAHVARHSYSPKSTVRPGVLCRSTCKLWA